MTIWSIGNGMPVTNSSGCLSVSWMMARRRRRAALAAKAGKVIRLRTTAASGIGASTRFLAANASSVPIAAERPLEPR